MAVIEIRNLVKRYGKTVAVNDVSFKVESGTFTVVLGPSGSGKTTLLRCVAGFEKPDAGDVAIDGVSMKDVPPRERDLAMVFQSYALFPLMTIHDNIGFPLKVRSVPATQIDSRVKEVAKLLGIEELLDKKPNQLSGGEQQRAALGRAIVREPKALLMDEPLTSLDTPLRAQMRTELKRIRRETNMTAIYVTHDQAEALALGDMLAIMNAGKLVEHDKPLEVYARPSNSFVAGFVGNPATNLLPATVDAANAKNTLRVGKATFRLDASAFEMVRQKAGSEAVIGVRPEDVRVDASKRSEGSLDVVVDTVEPLGSSLIVTTLLEGNPFKLVLPPDMLVRPGDHLWIAWEPNRMHVFQKSGDLIV